MSNDLERRLTRAETALSETTDAAQALARAAEARALLTTALVDGLDWDATELDAHLAASATPLADLFTYCGLYVLAGGDPPWRMPTDHQHDTPEQVAARQAGAERALAAFLTAHRLVYGSKDGKEDANDR